MPQLPPQSMLLIKLALAILLLPDLISQWPPRPCFFSARGFDEDKNDPTAKPEAGAPVGTLLTCPTQTKAPAASDPVSWGNGLSASQRKDAESRAKFRVNIYWALNSPRRLWQGLDRPGLKEDMIHGLTFVYAKGIDQVQLDSLDGGGKRFLRAIEENTGAAKRLLRLAQPTRGDPTMKSGQVPMKVQTWDELVEDMPEWGSTETSWVFHRDHPKVKRPGQPSSLVARVQKSGLCYLHAPDVMQHYLVAMGADDDCVEAKTPMVDLTNYLRQFFSAHDLYHHIWNDRGGYSLRTLRDLLLPGSVIDGVSIHGSGDSVTIADHERLRKVMSDCGPVLVSGFQVRDEFQVEGRLRYHGKAETNPVGFHAMVVIGIRWEEKDKSLRFLLQNWWPSKQFVEVDSSYLSSSYAVLFKVTTRQTGFPKHLPTITSDYAETDVDTGEKVCIYERT